MIAKMRKAFVVARHADQSPLLEAIRELGVVHITPLDAPKAVAGASMLGQIDHLGRAGQILSAIEPSGAKPELTALEAAEQTMAIQHYASEGRTRLSDLNRQIETLEIWGDVERSQFESLRNNGLDVRFYSAPAESVDQFRADVVQVLGDLPSKRCMVAVIARQGEPEIPEDASPVELPDRDRPAIRAEAHQIDEKLKNDAHRLTELAHLAGDLASTRDDLQEQAEYDVAQLSGLNAENLFAIQGWVPLDQAETLGADLAAAGIDCAVETHPPAEDEDPPTLIHYPRWVRPIKALFDMLGTNPGYREYDLSAVFMIALPIFAAMLIGDAGYGLLFVIFPIIYRKKLVAGAGKPALHLILTIGILTVIWGVITANYFGVSPQAIAEVGGFVQSDGAGDVQAMLDSGQGGWAAVGKTMFAIAPLYRIDFSEGLTLIMKISFILGTIQLVTGQLMQVVGIFPGIRFLAHVGWSIFLVGMLMLIWFLFPFGGPLVPNNIMAATLAVGSGLIVLFTCPNRNPVKWIGLGIASNILPIINTFSDSMSYIRLMAVGVASYFIAYSFNLLGSQVANSGATWAAGSVVVIFGHALNIVLAMIALFAHGVRLNMLEFSNNAGVQWAGHPFAPFKKRRST